MNGIDGKSKKLVIIALDAAEHSLVEKWSNEGVLPNLKMLMERSLSGRLGSSADWLAGSPWPTFYTGTNPAVHGLYHPMQWRSEKMASERPAPDWLGLTPFWRSLPDMGRDFVALDMPMTYGPGNVGGKEICGWATHDNLTPPAANPEGLLTWAERIAGHRVTVNEVYGPQSVHQLLVLRDELVSATKQLSGLALDMMDEFQWDLFAVTFGALHSGGHVLWDLSGATGEVSEAEATEFAGALREVYIACDAAVGALVSRLDADTSVLVFSLHGMGPNSSLTEILPEMLGRVLANGNGDAPLPATYHGLLKRLRNTIPIELRNSIKDRLPAALQDRLTSFWRLGGIDWTRTRAFPAIADSQGFIRINVVGREVAGIVESGHPYEALCRKIKDGLRTFGDADTGEPIILDVKNSSEIYSEGPRLERLPDLLVRWAHTPAAEHRAVSSDRFGTVAWPSPNRNPDGRSGNHRPEGFYLLRDTAAIHGPMRKDAHILDLAPTILRLLGLTPPDHMQGRMIL